jgi:hypothetical protein
MRGQSRSLQHDARLGGRHVKRAIYGCVLRPVVIHDVSMHAYKAGWPDVSMHEEGSCVKDGLRDRVHQTCAD